MKMPKDYISFPETFHSIWQEKLILDCLTLTLTIYI